MTDQITSPMRCSGLRGVGARIALVGAMLGVAAACGSSGPAVLLLGSPCTSGYTIVVLANLDPPAANRVASFISRRLPAK